MKDNTHFSISFQNLEKLFINLTNAFPVWVIIGAGLALWQPTTATWFHPQWIPLFLGIIMLSMGMTLEFTDFKRVLEIPRSILLGISLQFIIMPLLGYTLARAINLPADHIIGIILVASCPGGTASNVVCFIARAHVALSVSLTTFSTLAAVLVTPILTTILVESISTENLNSKVAVDTFGLLISTFQVVIFPLLTGIILKHFFQNWIMRINNYTPFFGVLSIVFIVDYILASKRQSILETGQLLLVAILILHIFGFLLGYILSKMFHFKEIDARTIAIEVGMQNSGLATELARSNFKDFGLATVPGAISALTHCILGALVAGLCRAFPKTITPEREPTKSF